MKKHSLFHCSWRVLWLALAFAPACARASSCCQHAAPVVAAYSPDSVFQLNSEWTNDAGASVSLDFLRGRWVVAGMFYASCSTVCPRLLHDLKQIEAALPDSVRERTGFLLVSLDPARDVPSVLRDFRDRNALDPARWHLWQGHPDDVRALAAAFGVVYRAMPNGDIAHSAPILLLNPEGEIAARLDDFNSPREPLLQMLREASP